MPSESQVVRSKSDTIYKILSVLFIPVFGWVVKLEVTNAIQNEQIAQLSQDVQENSNIAVSVQQNTTALVKVETKLDEVGRNIADIKRLLASQ